MNLGDSVTMDMAATPERVWELVADVTRIGELSPEAFEAEWLHGATRPVLGATFRRPVRRNGIGPVYWSSCRVTACEPGRSFGFEVFGPKHMVLNTWRYDIEPTATGSRVSESFQLSGMPATRIYWFLLGRWRGRTNRRGMTQTLTRAAEILDA